MLPIFWTLRLTPQTTQWAGIIVSLLLSLYIIYDGVKAHGKNRLAVTLLQAVGFGAVSLFLALTYLRADRLPEIVEIDLRSWGLMTVIGMFLCFLIQRHFGRKLGIDGDQILTIWVYGGLSAVAGARALHVLVNLGDFLAEPAAAFRFWDGGLAFIGGVIGALVFAGIYLKRQGHGLEGLDALTLGVALTHGFGRLGCFLGGCCYGRETELAVGVSFPPLSGAQYTMAQAGFIGPLDSTPPLHPTQLYEAAACFAIGFALLAWYKSGRARSGAILAAYFVLYPTARFFLELLRNDPEREFPFFRYPADSPYLLSTTQTYSLVLVPLALFVLWRVQSGRSSLR